jgi:hypothetical protein
MAESTEHHKKPTGRKTECRPHPFWRVDVLPLIFPRATRRLEASQPLVSRDGYRYAISIPYCQGIEGPHKQAHPGRPL